MRRFHSLECATRQPDRRDARLARECGLIRPVLVVLVPLLVLIGCSPASVPQSKLRVGWLPLFYGLPHFVAQEQHLYQKYGLETESTKFPTSNDLADALAAGRIDVAVPVSLAVLFSLEARAPGAFKLFSVYSVTASRPTDYVLVKSSSEIRDIAGLKGKRLGTFPGSTMRLYARLGLAPELNVPNDVQLVELRSDLQLPALLSDQVDALVTYDADAAAALASNEVRVLMAGVKTRIMDPFPSGGFAFAAKFAEHSPAQAANFEKAIGEAIALIVSDPIEARRNALTHLDFLTPELLSRMFAPDYVIRPRIDIELLNRYLRILRDAGELAAHVDARDLILQ
jgi:ABC-type nitrate/sulfonate/bicarbonate transport system substrate-binding protein